MKKITAIIVEDELDSRETLRNYVSKYCKEVRIVSECPNIQTAQTAIGIHQPDLVFLDIEMPYGNAFDLLEQLETIDFEIIFITAFDQYAVQAFKLSAVHYLLKPLDIEELISAVDKAKSRIEKSQKINQSKILLENMAALNTQQQKVVLPLLDGFEVVKLSDILYCEAEDNFTCFYFTNNKKALICRKLKFFENALTPHRFCRVHRSYLINLEYVKRYLKGKGGSVVLENGVEIPVAVARKGGFLEQFK